MQGKVERWQEAKRISTQFSRELGFVNIAALKESESKGYLEVINNIGFANFHHRRDKQTTIYEIAVCKWRLSDEPLFSSMYASV